MSDVNNIPFEIQTEIMRRLPVKSLLQFRSVSKSYKSLIHTSDFIIRHISQQHHLLISYYDYEPQYVSLVDTFSQQKVSLTIHPFAIQHYTTIGSSHGLFCLYDDDMALLWNPSIRKTVTVVFPNMPDTHIHNTVIGFGVCRQTTDPKIVKIAYMENIVDIPWEVEVFTLSTRAWRSVSTNLPRNSVRFGCDQVVIDGCIYWLATDGLMLDDGMYWCYDLIISFDMTREEFGEVRLPDSHSTLSMYKLRESLVVIEFVVEGNELLDHVWMMEDGVPKKFKKLYTISSHSPDVLILRVCGFRKTGEPLIEVSLRDHHDSTITLAAYDPYSKSISNLGINVRPFSYSVYSYMETLLLL